jgi:hypothetical protein
MANNPSLDLLTEIAEYNIASRATGHLDDIVEPTVLLSLGKFFFNYCFDALPHLSLGRLNSYKQVTVQMYELLQYNVFGEVASCLLKAKVKMPSLSNYVSPLA